MTPDTLITVGLCLSSGAILMIIIIVVLLTLKAKKATVLANAPLPKMEGLPRSFRRMGAFTEFAEHKQRQEQQSKAIKSMANPVLYSNLALTVSGIAFLVGLIMVVVGLLQKYPPSWW